MGRSAFSSQSSSQSSSQQFANLPLHGNVHLHVRSGRRVTLLDPHKYPHLNHFIVHSSPQQQQHLPHQTPAKVSISPSSTTTSSDVAEQVEIHVESDAECSIEMPAQYNLNVNQSSAASVQPVFISGLENQQLHVSANGPIHLHNCKTGSAVIASALASISSTSLLQAASVQLSAKDVIEAERLLTNHLLVHLSASGRIHLQSVYCGSSGEVTLTGSGSPVHVLLGSAHGRFKCHLDDEGSILVKSLDGALDARLRSGHVHIHLARPSDVEVDLAEGNVDLSVPAESSSSRHDAPFHCHFHLTANAPTEGQGIQVHPGICLTDLACMDMPHSQSLTGTMGNLPEPIVRVTTREGKISLTQKSWLESISMKL